MTSDGTASEVIQIEAALRGAVRGLDPAGIGGASALELYRAFDRIARAAAAAKVLLAARVEASGAHRLAGHATAADLLAATSGVSLGSAKSELETSGRLASCPGVKDALVDGRISQDQGRVIADAAVVNPAAADDLILKAGRTNHTGLKQEALKAKAAADLDPSVTEDRIRTARRVSRFTDGEGARCLSARGPVTDASIIETELDALTDQIFQAHGKTGTRDCRDAYAWDAWLLMARNSRAHRTHRPARSSGAGPGGPGLGGTGSSPDRADTVTTDTDPGDADPGSARTAPEHLALLRVDIEALQRGRVDGDELCEIAGLGPISIPAARALLGQASLKLLITSGTDVLNVTSLTRGPTQAMKYAALWSNPTCCVEGCTRTRVEYDHIWGAEYAKTRHTRLDELERVCHHHHDLHTRADWALLPGPPDARPLVPPEDPRHPGSNKPPVPFFTPEPPDSPNHWEDTG